MFFIDHCIQELQKLIDSVKAPFGSFPGTLLAVTAPLRSGLSAERITSEIISRQPEAGAPVGPLPNGKKNVAEEMEKIRVECLIKDLHENCKVQITIPPGALYIKSIGSNAGGPVISEGTNLIPITGEGIIS